MSRMLVFVASLSVFLSAAACSDDRQASTAAESGGNPATGGSTGWGGALSSGGTVTYVLAAIGGQPLSAGGTATAGGASATGGTANDSKTGGATAAGGTTHSGGARLAGGSTAAGGTGASTGGASRSGGATAQAGAGTGGGAAAVPKSCVGWASVNAEGQNGTTGGANGPVVEITSGEQLATYYKSSGVINHNPMVFRIMNDISGEIQLGSNKTIEGAKKGITLNGGLVFSGKGGVFSNLIIRNLRINGLKSSEDGIDIRMAHHVCIEHCEIFDGPDGNLDIVNQANYITVAYTKFYYTSAYKPLPSETEATNHRFSNLIGNSDGATTDIGKLKVTFHHNWWGDLVIERMPRIRFGEVHLFNNYFSSKGNKYCIGAGEQAKVVAENNYFEDVNNPHIFHEGSKTAQIVATGNEYVRVTGLKDVGQGDAFKPPYPYTPELASSVKANVMASAGPQ